MKLKFNSHLFRVFAVLVLLIMQTGVFSQYDVPKVVQPSPTTSQLFKFQDYPMDYSTGLPQISIPLYEVNSGSLNVPITLGYHASGRKVTDLNGPIALGWSISAGGSISRVIHGAPDFGAFKFPFPFTTTGLTNYSNLTYLQRIIRFQDNGYCGGIYPYLDAEYDVFSYSFPGGGGKFVFKDNNNVKTAVTLPYKPIVVTPNNPSPGVLSFEIIDEKGVTYQFGASEFTQIDEYATTAWNLEKMISADKTDTVSFVYVGGTETRRSINQVITYKDNWNMAGMLEPTPPAVNPTFAENTSQLTYQTSVISEIKFNQGKVKFNLVSGTTRIDNIQILNLRNEVIKTINLSTTTNYYQSDLINQTYKLDSVLFRDKANAPIETFRFEYYPIIASAINGPINPRYCDWWGYYNNSGQHDMIPKYTISSLGFQTSVDIGNPNANRNPSLEPMKSSVLKKITYPTGGSTEFTYENNKCIITGGSAYPVVGPGLRIYQINSTDGSGVLNTKTYKYGANESDYGYLELLPDISTIKNEFTTVYFPGNSWVPTMAPNSASLAYFRQRDFTSSMYEDIGELAARPVLYQEVTEYLGTPSSNTGKNIYKYDYAPWGAAGLFPKKHIYNFNYWNTPSLISTEQYKKTTTGYSIVLSSNSTFNAVTTEYIYGLHVQRAYSMAQAGYGSSPTPGNPTPTNVCSEKFAAYTSGPPFGQIQVYSFSDYRIQAGYKNLTQTVQTQYTDAGNIITTTSYTYNAKNLVSSVTTTSSKGETILSQTNYPSDYTGNATLSQMVGLNMINFPVEQINSKSSATTTAVKTNYLNFGTTPARIYPQTVEGKQGTNAYETRLRFNQYDNSGNLLTVSKENDAPLSYIWGYNSTYPIAELRNVSATEISAYSSFESNGTGNWSYSGIGFTDGSAPTGIKVYNLTPSTSISKTGLNSGTTYIVSYWTKNASAFSIAGTLAGYPLNNFTVNGWKYFEHRVSGQTTVTISGTGVIDELRLYPATAQMVTYSYEPLVGMTHQCDVNNKIVKYEYDDYSRLVLIRDQDKNVIKKICYNYSGQTETCNIFYNDQRSGSFTASCAPGYTGSAVAYTIPAGTYSASSLTLANQKADADIAANGQAYANAVGTCTQSSTSCSFTVSSGFTIFTSGISKSGSTVTFYIVFKTLSPSTNWYNLNQVATISTACRPTMTRTLNMSEGGRNWEVVIYPAGGFNVRLLSGTPPTTSTTIGLSNGTYTQ